MADSRFFQKKGPFSLAELAASTQCVILRGDPGMEIRDIAPLETADASCISLFDHVKYTSSLAVSQAGACILAEGSFEKAPKDMALLGAHYPKRTFALIAGIFYPQDPLLGGIDPTARVHPTAILGEGVTIGPMAVIGAHVELGEFVEIGPFTVIGEGVIIGDRTLVESHVSLSHALIGKAVHIKPGARIGQGGFGFFRDTGDMGGHVPVPQLGRVILHDYVEIGANTTVDRGSGHDTVIGEGTRIDNLVQIAHNVHFGKGCIMVAQSGVAGSTKFGDYVAAAGQAGIADNLKIGTGARLAAQSGIMRDVLPGETLAGSPAMPVKAHYRQVAVLKRLEEETRIKSHKK